MCAGHRRARTLHTAKVRAGFKPAARLITSRTRGGATSVWPASRNGNHATPKAARP